MKKLLRYLKKYILQCILAPLFKMLEASFELIVPLVIAALIDDGIGSGNTGIIMQKVVVLFVLAFVGMVAAITAQYFAAKAAIGFATNVRSALFSHMMSLSAADADKLTTSTMINRMTTDINQAQTGVNMFLRLFLRSPFVVFGAMIMAFTIDVKEALIFLAVIIVLFLVVAVITAANIPALKIAQGKLDNITRVVRENLMGVRTLRAFRLEKKEIEDFDSVNKNYVIAGKHAGAISALLNPVTYLIINLAIAVLIYTGGLQVRTGTLSTGQVIALYNYMSQILVELVKLSNLVVTLNKGVTAAGRISDVLQTSPSMVYGKSNGDDVIKGVPQIEFENVSLTYGDAKEAALMNVSLQIYAGQTIGIIGGTGSGKSSMVNLFTRQYDATSGSVRFYGKDIKDYSKEYINSKVCAVLQKAVLIKGTIEDNLRMGNKNCTNEEMITALKAAQAYDFVCEKGGLSAAVEQDGRNFSGGQRQRLSIARAIVAHHDIVLFDDSTSALDYVTERAFRQALENVGEGVTKIIISQRTSSIMNADMILVFEDGEMVGVGTHEELLNNCEVYKEIHNSAGRQYEEVQTV
ncbi:MAG: ABC transporter ATP-binding protein [Lachnospiraceae bacterium]|nr:ABC transporter ATP-binding protein [Candidatus Colinaster equi]